MKKKAANYAIEKAVVKMNWQMRKIRKQWVSMSCAYWEVVMGLGIGNVKGISKGFIVLVPLMLPGQWYTMCVHENGDSFELINYNVLWEFVLLLSVECTLYQK